MNKVGDLCAKTGTYKDRTTGEEKSSWKNCGALFMRDDGSHVVKLESLPVGQFSGWLNVFEPREGNLGASARPNTTPTPPQQASARPGPPAVANGAFADDDIPF